MFARELHFLWLPWRAPTGKGTKGTTPSGAPAMALSDRLGLEPAGYDRGYLSTYIAHIYIYIYTLW